jgi:hypothetical protein
MHTISRVGLVGLGALALLLLIPAEQADAGCRECNAVRRGCRAEAAATYVGCVTGCPREGRDAWLACRRLCRDDRRSDRLDCQLETEQCTCATNRAEKSCARACTDEFRDCLRNETGPKQTRRTCLEGCYATGRASLEACKARPDSGLGECLSELAGSLGPCVAACAQDAAGLVRFCTDGLRGCLSSCQRPPPVP